ADPSATIGFQRHQPFLVEPDQGRTDRRPPGAELGRHGRLDQALVGMELTTDDRLAEPVVGIYCDGPDSHLAVAKIILNNVDNHRHASTVQYGGTALRTFHPAVRLGSTALSAVTMLLLAACGGGTNTSGGGLGSGDLLVGVIAPF